VSGLFVLVLVLISLPQSLDVQWYMGWSLEITHRLLCIGWFVYSDPAVNGQVANLRDGVLSFLKGINVLGLRIKQSLLGMKQSLLVIRQSLLGIEQFRLRIKRSLSLIYILARVASCSSI